MGVNYKQPAKPTTGIIITDQELLQIVKRFREGNESIANTAKRLLIKAVSEELDKELQPLQRPAAIGPAGGVIRLRSLARRA